MRRLYYESLRIVAGIHSNIYWFGKSYRNYTSAIKQYRAIADMFIVSNGLMVTRKIVEKHQIELSLKNINVYFVYI